MIDAVIFDLDGLLVDSEPVWFRARRQLCALHGAQWTEDDHRAQMGVDTETWVDYMFAHLGGRLERDAIRDGVIAEMAACYREGDIPKRAGADVAVRLCSNRYRTGLASGSPRLLIEAALEGGGWAGAFEEVLSSDEVERGKPAPDVYVEVMRRMELEPETTAVLEDSAGGIRAGAAAGCRVIAVPSPEAMPPEDVLALASLRIGGLDELFTALDELDLVRASG